MLYNKIAYVFLHRLFSLNTTPKLNVNVYAQKDKAPKKELYLSLAKEACDMNNL
jgi:hypothetical protein